MHDAPPLDGSESHRGGKSAADGTGGETSEPEEADAHAGDCSGLGSHAPSMKHPSFTGAGREARRTSAEPEGDPHSPTPTAEASSTRSISRAQDCGANRLPPPAPGESKQAAATLRQKPPARGTLDPPASPLEPPERAYRFAITFGAYPQEYSFLMVKNIGKLY
jgi:hypothetical protein